MSLKDLFKAGGRASPSAEQRPRNVIGFVRADAAQIKGLGEMLIARAINPPAAGEAHNYFHTESGREANVCIVGADAAQVKGLGHMLVAGGGNLRIAGGSYLDGNFRQGGRSDIFLVGADAAQVKSVGEILAAGGGKAMATDEPYIGVIAGRGEAPSVFIVGADASQIEQATRKMSLEVNSQPRQTTNALFDYFDQTFESDHFRNLLDKAR